MVQLHLDYLQISLTKSRPLEDGAGGRFVLTPLPFRVANYERVYELSYIGSVPVARVFDFNKLAPNFIKLKIENFIFYTGNISIERLINDFCEDFGAMYHHLIQVDIALDSDLMRCCDRDPEQFITDVVTERITREPVFNRSYKSADYKSYEVRGKKHAETLYLSKTNVCLKLYNKTKELVVSGKQYIINGWPSELAGDVWRCELSIKNEALERIIFDGQQLSFVDLSIFDEPERQIQLFWWLLDRFFIMVVHKRGYTKRMPLLSRPDMVVANNIQYARKRVKPEDIFSNNVYTKGLANWIGRASMGEGFGKLLNDSELNTLYNAYVIIENLRRSVPAARVSNTGRPKQHNSFSDNDL